MRLGHDQCAIKRIHILEETILLLSDNPDFPPVLACSTDLDELIIDPRHLVMAGPAKIGGVGRPETIGNPILELLLYTEQIEQITFFVPQIRKDRL